MAEAAEESRYSLVLQWDPRRDIYVTTVPELPGCRAGGGTWEEAVQGTHTAVAMSLDSFRLRGAPLPRPRLYGQKDRWRWMRQAVSTRRRRGFLLAIVLFLGILLIEAATMPMSWVVSLYFPVGAAYCAIVYAISPSRHTMNTTSREASLGKDRWTKQSSGYAGGSQ